jgi:hypothetical protein
MPTHHMTHAGVMKLVMAGVGGSVQVRCHFPLDHPWLVECGVGWVGGLQGGDGGGGGT